MALAHQIQPHQVVQRPTHDVRFGPDHGLEQRQPELPAEDRRGHQRLPGAGIQPVDARQDDLLDRGRHLERRVVDEAPTLVVVHHRTGIHERPDQLLQEERIALGGFEDPALHVGGQRVVADERVQQLAAGVARQRFQRHIRDPVRELAGDVLLHAPPRVIALQPGRQDQQERHGLGVREQPLEQLQRRRVGPVQVLEHDGHGPVLRETRDQLADDLERPILQRLGRELRETFGRIGLERQPEQGRQVRRELGRARAERPLDHPAERDADPQLRLVREDADPGPQEVAERPVRQGLSVRDAPALQPQRAAVLRRTRVEPVVQLGQQPRLADPRLAGDEEDAARAREDAGDRVAAGVELPVAADQPNLHALQAPRSHGGPGRGQRRARHDRCGLPLEVERRRGAPVEHGLDQPERLLPDEHPPRLAERLQPGRRVHGVAERRVFDAAPRADRADDDRSGLDADAHAEPGHTPGGLDLARVLGDLLHDLQRRAHGALGVVLVRGGGAEQRQHAVSREVLDRPSERFDGPDHARQGVADDDLQLLRIQAFGEHGGTDQIGEDRGDHAPLFADLAGIVRR